MPATEKPPVTKVERAVPALATINARLKENLPDSAHERRMSKEFQGKLPEGVTVHTEKTGFDTIFTYTPTGTRVNAAEFSGRRGTLLSHLTEWVEKVKYDAELAARQEAAKVKAGIVEPKAKE